MKALTIVSMLVFSAVAVATAWQQAPATELKEGDVAPNFSLVGSDGKTHKLSDNKGRAVVLAWFPKAFTGG
jgi:peroxiredoxin Q/BCP